MNPEKKIFVSINGQIMEEAEARISPLDRGFLYGDGLFETIKARANRVEFLDEHLARMEAGARLIGIPFPRDIDFSQIILELADKNRIEGETAARISLTRGRHEGSLSLYEPSQPTLVILARPYQSPDTIKWNQGLSLTVEEEIRQNPSSWLCRLKNLNYLQYLLLRTRAEQKGFDEAILINTNGQICECTTSNIFFFRQGRLETPAVSCGLLPGILRNTLMECLTAAGEPVREVMLTDTALKESEEVFVTNSLQEIMPVGQVDEKTFPARERTAELMKRFSEYRDVRHGWR